MIVRNRPKVTLILVVIVAALCLFSNATLQAQDKNSSPIFEDVTLSANFSPDPMTVRGLSGGPLLAQQVAKRSETATGPCIGFVDEKPDHRLVLTSFFQYLSLQVKSSEDTTLVIRGPGGSWCNDDYDGKNPTIIGQWLSGTYEIWIGSYQKQKYYPYILRISQRERL